MKATQVRVRAVHLGTPSGLKEAWPHEESLSLSLVAVSQADSTTVTLRWFSSYILLPCRHRAANCFFLSPTVHSGLQVRPWDQSCVIIWLCRAVVLGGNSNRVTEKARCRDYAAHHSKAHAKADGMGFFCRIHQTWGECKNPATKKLTGFPEKLVSGWDTRIRWALPALGLAAVRLSLPSAKRLVYSISFSPLSKPTMWVLQMRKLRAGETKELALSCRISREESAFRMGSGRRPSLSKCLLHSLVLWLPDCLSFQVFHLGAV